MKKVAVHPFTGFNEAEAQKTRRALNMVARKGVAPSRRMQESLEYYDLIGTVGPDPVCQYNHLGLTLRGEQLLAQLSA